MSTRSRIHRRFGGAALLAAVLAVLLPAAADSRPLSRTTRVDVPIERIRSEVSIHVDGRTRLATYEVLEEFRNNTGRVLQGDYLYPIPAGAVFRNLSLFAGETELRGEMLDADRARAIYEEIVRRKLDPALVELFGHGLLRARVFPIEAGATRTIILRYVQALEGDGGLTRLRYPLGASRITTGGDVDLPVVRPRPGPEVRPMPRLTTVRPSSIVARRSRVDLRVRIDNASVFASPYSPSHAVQFRPGGDDSLTATLTGIAAGGALRPFDLLLPLVSDRLSASVLAHSPDPERESGYFMLHLAPPAVADPEQIARDVTMVLDVSGSMAGHKIEQARAALAQMLRGLRRDDRFRLITYASVVRSHAAELVPATPAAIERAVSWLHGVAADGSTNIDAALRDALAPEAAADRLTVVVFLTDGRPTAGQTDPVRIGETAGALRDGERVFAFGIGDDVNTYVLERMIEGGRGAVEYVAPGDDVEPVVAALARKIGVPALADLRIVAAPAALEDLVPDPLPDLFYGEELVLFGRYRGAGRGLLVLEGRRGGRSERFEFDVDLPRRTIDNEAVARLWASRKVGALTAHLRLHGSDPEVIEQIRQLGLRYGVLTEYTAYLVEEPGLAADRAEARRRAEALAMAPAQQSGADAVRRAASGGRMAKLRAEAEADEMVRATAVDAVGDRATWERAGDRLFVAAEHGWRDLRVDDTAPVLTVRVFSAAWFRLASVLPGLRPALALGESVMIGGSGLTLKIGPDGIERLDRDDAARLARAFPAEAR